MMRLNLNLERPFGVWTRLNIRARLAHSLTADGPATALRNAVELMRAEQRAEGIKAGILMCEYSDCPCAATHTWMRSAADLKSMRRKHKGTWLTGQPDSIRCETHVPGWLVSKYQPLGRLEQLAA